MASLDAFLNPVYTERKIEVVVGDRFVDENGKPVPIVMRSLTQDELNEIGRASTKEKKVGGKTVMDMDAIENLNRCLVASIVFPDLTSEAICKKCKTIDPSQVPSRLFLIDEYTKLAKAFAELNGLKDDNGEFNPPGEITKN